MTAVAASNPYYRSFELPGTTGGAQEHRFRRLTWKVLLVVLVFSLIMPLLPVPERAADRVEDIPPRLARFVLEREPPPPPPVVREEPRPVEPEVAVVEPPREVVPPEPRPEPRPEARVEEARERASTAGVMPMVEELAALRESAALSSVLDANTVSSAAQASRAERAMITSRAGEASSGITTAELSRGTGGGGLAERTATTVESPVAGLVAEETERRGGASDGVGSRSREEIEMVFDQHKGAIYALYSRALRADPTLQGKVVLRLTIAPNGTVTECEVVSSELGDAELERRLVQRVMMFRFEDRDVAPVTTTKPIEFFPA